MSAPGESCDLSAQAARPSTHRRIRQRFMPPYGQFTFLMTGDEPGKPRRIGRSAISSPGDVQVGTQQDQLMPVKLAGAAVVDVQHLKRCAERFHGFPES